MAPHSDISKRQPPVNQNDTTKKSRLGDVLRLVLFLGIGALCIYWSLLKLDSSQKAAIWQSFLGADYWWVAAAMACCLLSHLVRAMRWRLLFHPLGFKPSLNNTFGSVVIAYMANLAFPRAGEVMRCATLRTSEGIPVEKSLGTVVTERAIDALAFGLIVLLGFSTVKDLLYNSLSDKFEHLPNMAMLIGVAVVAAVLAFLFYRLFWKRLLHIGLFRKIDELVRNLIASVKSILQLGWKRTLLFVFYSVVIYTLYILGGLIIFHAFSETSGLDFDAAFVLYLYGSVGMTFSQGGIGVYPMLVQWSLDKFGVSMEVGTACGWLLWGSQQAIVILVGTLYLVYFSIIKKKQKLKTA